MINTLAQFVRHENPFPYYTLDDVISAPDIARLNADLPSLDLFKREVKEGPQHRKNYRMWLFDLYSDGQVDPRADELPPAWRELLDSILSDEFAAWVTVGLGVDVTGLRLTVGIYRYFEDDYTTVDTGKLQKAVHWALYLNEQWTQADGGAMHLWAAQDAPQPAVAVVPRGGTSAVFLPSPVSWHNIDTIRATEQDRINIMIEYWKP